MKIFRKYRIRIEDEAHLTEVMSGRTNLPVAFLIITGIVLAMLVVSGMIIAYTPLRTLLPGYLKESQRSANEEGLLRLDSLMEIYEKDRAFIENFLTVTDVDRNPSDSASMVSDIDNFQTDTLIGPSKAEKSFMARMEESERFNVSVLAPLAAENMMFYPISGNGVFTKESESSSRGKIIMAPNENIQSAANGSVIAIYYSAPEHGYVILVQHKNGFVTAYSHTGTPMAVAGDGVEAGQVLALAPSPDADGSRWFLIRMWHNGLPVVPYEYLAEKTFESAQTIQKYEAPRGKE